MYDPKGNAKDRAVPQVDFIEAPPPPHLAGVVHRYLSLRTPQTLTAPYRFHALPDACTYIVFDQLNADIAGVTRLRASSEELSLGTQFHFVNLRFLPGVWQRDRIAPAYGLVETPYEGPLPLREINAAIQGQPFGTQQEHLNGFVQSLVDQGILRPNPVTEAVFAQLDDIFSVADMAQATGLSPRQLQRRLKSTTGFTPHDFLKVLRLQQSLGGEPSLSYADQSHFIHSFRKATGYTPGAYAKKFDV